MATKPALPVRPAPELDWYIARMTTRQWADANKEYAKQFSARVVAMKDAVKSAYHAEKAPDIQRLATYTARMPQEWEMLRTALPRKYNEQMSDWRKLAGAE